MSQPVDLTNLREMTDGDKDLETALFQEFFSSSEKLLDELNQALASNNTEEWRRAAHSLKGTSYNLGAAQLGDYCKAAQEGNLAPHEEKASLYETIASEYELVKYYLLQQG